MCLSHIGCNLSFLSKRKRANIVSNICLNTQTLSGVLRGAPILSGTGVPKRDTGLMCAVCARLREGVREATGGNWRKATGRNILGATSRGRQQPYLSVKKTL